MGFSSESPWDVLDCSFFNNSVPDGVLYAFAVGMRVSDCRFSWNTVDIGGFFISLLYNISNSFFSGSLPSSNFATLSDCAISNAQTMLPITTRACPTYSASLPRSPTGSPSAAFLDSKLFDGCDTFQRSAVPSASARFGGSSGALLQWNTLCFGESLIFNSHALLQTVIRDSACFSITAVWFVATTSANESGVLSGLSIGLIIGAAAIIVFVIAFVLLLFKRRRRDASGRGSEWSASAHNSRFGSDTTLGETQLTYDDATTFEAAPSTMNTFVGDSETPTGRNFVRMSLL
jgi:hypothetical protein